MATPQQVSTGASCYYPLDDKLACIIYLLNTTNMTTAQIQAGARCYEFLDDKLACIIYLIASGAVPGTGTFSGTGSPEGVVTANPGATYLQTDTGSLWAKRTGNGNTGWIEIVA